MFFKLNLTISQIQNLPALSSVAVDQSPPCSETSFEIQSYYSALATIAYSRGVAVTGVVVAAIFAFPMHPLNLQINKFK